MKICPKCKQVYDDNSVFCEQCENEDGAGVRLVEAKDCPNCGKTIPKDAKCCIYCGVNTQNFAKDATNMDIHGNAVRGDLNITSTVHHDETYIDNTVVHNEVTNNSTTNIIHNDDNNDLIIKNKKVLNGKTNFDVYYKGEFFDNYSLSLFGDHLILDASAAILVGILFDVSKFDIKISLENYKPALRRFNEEIIGDNVIVDDYAHHPTEIKVTYDSAHQKYPDKEIIAVFLPNTYSRTQDLFDDFVNALKMYDKAYLMDIKCDREKQEDYPLVSSSKLVDEIPNSEMIDLETCNKLLTHQNAVVCFMSCANISNMVNEYRDLLKND